MKFLLYRHLNQINYIRRHQFQNSAHLSSTPIQTESPSLNKSSFTKPKIETKRLALTHQNESMNRQRTVKNPNQPPQFNQNELHQLQEFQHFRKFQPINHQTKSATNLNSPFQFTTIISRFKRLRRQLRHNKTGFNKFTAIRYSNQMPYEFSWVYRCWSVTVVRRI